MIDVHRSIDWTYIEIINQIKEFYSRALIEEVQINNFFWVVDGVKFPERNFFDLLKSFIFCIQKLKDYPIQTDCWKKNKMLPLNWFLFR